MYACGFHPFSTLRCSWRLPYLQHPTHPSLFPSTSTNPSFNRNHRPLIDSPPNPTFLFTFRSFTKSSCDNSASSYGGNEDDDDENQSVNLLSDDDDDAYAGAEDSQWQSVSGDGVDVEIEKLGKNSRRITSRVAIEADLGTVWSILTDYEKLADFIPGLLVSRLIEKRENFARIYQVGQQNLALGLKFNAKGTVDCYEKDLESLPHGQKRDIEFKMIKGDFQIFEGKWSIEQNTGCEASGSLREEEFNTYLSYIVDVKPKLWLPVRLVEGRLAREIKINLACIQEKAKNALCSALHNH